MQSHAQPEKKFAQLIALNKFKMVICPWSDSEYDLNAKKGAELQQQLILRLQQCGLKSGIDFYYASPNSIEMIRFERYKALLAQYYVEFTNTATVLNALKVLPAHFIFHSQGPVNLADSRTRYMLQHNDNEGVMPADLKEIMELHQRSYLELSAKVDVAIQTKAGGQHPALVNFQAAKRYIDESIKDDPYSAESSRYSMLMLALWYVVEELSVVKDEDVKKGFLSIFRKVKAEASPVNQQYNALLKEYLPFIPTRFTGDSMTSKQELKALYMEKIGKHITVATRPEMRK